MLVFCRCAGMETRDGDDRPKLTPEARGVMMIQVANGAILERDPVGALQALKQAETLAPDNPDLHHTKALAFFLKQDLTSAIASARRSVELKPDYSVANNTLGKLLMDAGQYAEAETYLQKAANDNLSYEAFKARTNLGVLNYQRGKYTVSRFHLDLAIREEPKEACVARFYRAQLFLRESKAADAIKDLKGATMDACSRYGEAHLALGMAYLQNHQNDLARKKLFEVSQLFPGTDFAERSLEALRNVP